MESNTYTLRNLYDGDICSRELYKFPILQGQVNGPAFIDASN